MSEARQSRMEESPKRRAILDAAAELFLAHGYGAVSMEVVARTAGVSKATLYAHFVSKDALFAAIIAGNWPRLAAEIESFAGGHELELREALEGLGRRWLGFMLSPHVLGIHRVAVAEGARFPDLANAFLAQGPKRMLAWLAGWMAEEQRRGRIRPGTDPVRAAEQFVGLLRGELFLRATLGLLEAEEVEPGLSATTAAAAETFMRAYATPQS
jgi:TetR/AcrR family transcriptional repressor of mexJK operon